MIDRWLRRHLSRRRNAGRKGVAKFRRFPAAGRESCDLNCTGCEPSFAGRATTGPMTRYERSMCRKPLYLQLNPQWPGGAEGSRTEPVGLQAAFWWVRLAHPDTGQPFYPVPPIRKGLSMPSKGLRFVIGTQEPMPSARFGAGLAAENGDGPHGGGAPRSSRSAGKPHTWRRGAEGGTTFMTEGLSMDFESAVKAG